MIQQILSISDKTLQEHHDDAVADEEILLDDSKVDDTTTTVEGNTEETNGTLHSEQVEEKSDLSEVGKEMPSDEGWQEANSKGRSGSTANRKFSKRRPLLAKLSINSSESCVVRECSYRNNITSPPQKVTPKSMSSVVSPSPRQSKSPSLTSKQDSVNHPTVSSLASKSMSYKEVALAPPGTVLKPSLEKAEVDMQKAENEMCNSYSPHVMSKNEERCQSSTVEAVSQQAETDETHKINTKKDSSASELEVVSLSSDQPKPSESNGSKLSAAAEPFNPGTPSMAHHLNSVAVTSIYGENVSEAILVEPVLPPSSTRVPCGPRSPLYYQTTYTSRVKHGFEKYYTPITDRNGFGATRNMNPHAPEFVPRRASKASSGIAEEKKVNEGEVRDSSSRKRVSESEKSELARQILLSFLVKSVQRNANSAVESGVSEGKHENMRGSSEATAKDSAVIKILHGNQEKLKMVPQQEKVDSENKNINGDGEGFRVVTKRRRSRQKLTSGVMGLCNQQSICASVR